MNDRPSIVSDFACWALSAVFLLGLVVLAVNLYAVQVEDSAEMRLAAREQSVRRVRLAAPRGQIVDRNGIVLAGSRPCFSIVCHCEYFGRRRWEDSASAIIATAREVALATGLVVSLQEDEVVRYLKRGVSVPLTVWDDIDRFSFERFCEHSRMFPGFSVEEREERDYPFGPLAAHVLGFTGSAEAGDPAVEGSFYFRQKEMAGRAGLEYFYDAYLRGVPGVRLLTVDSRCFAVSEETAVKPERGLDLELALDSKIQRAVEKELGGQHGACVVIDPRDGGVLAAASAPAYDLRLMVPRLSTEMNSAYIGNREFRNRFSGETYAPGSTFKPVTALAGLSMGVPAEAEHECTGAFSLGEWTLRCSRTWGHGRENMRTALRDSCNPYFCALGNDIGTNALIRAAKAFGLGEVTGADLPGEMRGVVPDGAWKRRVYGERWYPGDLPQMSIGQGMLTVTPLQMACVAGAIGTGRLVRPHFKKTVRESVVRSALPFSSEQLRVVRDGMEAVVNDSRGSGVKGGVGVPVRVAGKTGTAEVGTGERRRKNTWFIAYAPAEAPEVAVALVIEDGVSGGSTAAPKVAEILRGIFADKGRREPQAERKGRL